MGKKVRAAICVLAVLCAISMCSATGFADTAKKADGNLVINMSYDIEEFYLAAGPHFYVFLEREEADGDPAQYFVKLEYDKNTKVSSAVINAPVVGTYHASYYGAKPRKEDNCDEAVKAGANPNEQDDLFKKLEVRSDFAGGFMVLKTAPETVTVGSSGGALSVVSTHHTRRETLVAGAFISLSGIKSTTSLFDVDLYISDRKGTPLEKIKTESTTKATTAKKGYPRYFDAILAPAPGTYYFLGKERVDKSLFKAASPVLYTLNVGYQNDRMVPKKLTIKQGKALRSISVSGSSKVNVTVSDNRATGASYYMYGPFDKSFPYEKEKSDGTFPGKKSVLKKNGSKFTISIKPTADRWDTYVLVKKTVSGINRGDSIYFSVNAVPFAGSTVTVWRIRASATYTSLYKPVPPEASTFSKAVSGNKQVTLRWAKRTDVDGFEIQYSQNSNFTAPVKKARIFSGKAVSQTIKNLKSGKTYFFRIRTYRKSNPTTKVYSKWSAKQKVNVK